MAVVWQVGGLGCFDGLIVKDDQPLRHIGQWNAFIRTNVAVARWMQAGRGKNVSPISTLVQSRPELAPADCEVEALRPAKQQMSAAGSPVRAGYRQPQAGALPFGHTGLPILSVYVENVDAGFGPARQAPVASGEFVCPCFELAQVTARFGRPVFH